MVVGRAKGRSEVTPPPPSVSKFSPSNHEFDFFFLCLLWHHLGFCAINSVKSHNTVSRCMVEPRNSITLLFDKSTNIKCNIIYIYIYIYICMCVCVCVILFSITKIFNYKEMGKLIMRKSIVIVTQYMLSNTWSKQGLWCVTKKK